MAREVTKNCSLCDAEIHDENYPRYRIRLTDESDTEPDRLSENRVCSCCWETLSQALLQSDE